MASRGRRDSRSSPTAGTAELLGLLCPVRMPRASKVALTTHCVERFRERVKPDMDFREARRALVGLIGGCHVMRERPPGFGPGLAEMMPSDTLGFIYVPARQGGVAMALPIRHAGGGQFVATTCLVAGQ